MSNLLPRNFHGSFAFCSVSSSTGKILKPSHRTEKISIAVGVINFWNKTQHQLSGLPRKKDSTTKTKL